MGASPRLHPAQKVSEKPPVVSLRRRLVLVCCRSAERFILLGAPKKKSPPPQKSPKSGSASPRLVLLQVVTSGLCVLTARERLEVEVADPVDDVEEQEGGGEEDPGVGIQLADVDVDAALPPAAFFTLLVAAEEAGAVFAVQALVQAVVFVVVPEQGVAHGHHGPRGVGHVEGRVGLGRKREREGEKKRLFYVTNK